MEIISLSAWKAQRAQASAESVAVGTGPLPALAAPAVNGAAPTFVIARGGKPLIATPGSDFEPPRTVQALWPRRPLKDDAEPSERDLENSPGPVCFVDRAARLATVRSLGAAGMTELAKRLSYLVRLDIPGPVEVLTAALNRKYVTPEGANPGSLAEWVKMFGLAGSGNDLETFRELWARAGGKLTKPQSLPWDALTKAADWFPVTLGGDPGDAYRSVSSAADTWEVIRRIDPIGRAAGVIDGTVSLLDQAPRLVGGIAETPVSVPFRVRDGAVLAVDDTGESWEALLDGTVYTDRGLAARFLLPPAGRGRRLQEKGYVRISTIDDEHPLWVTNSPFLLPPASRLTGRWARRRDTQAPSVTGIVPREVPMHVALAGAG